MNCEELVKDLRARDPDALMAAFDRYGHGLYGYCCSLLRDIESARGALGDAFTVAELRIDELSDPRRLRAWLYAVARNECLHRRSGPKGRSDRTGGEAGFDPPASTDGTQPRAVALSALTALRPHEREVLELSVRHGLPDADIAAVLGSGTRWVGGALARAERKLEHAVVTEIIVRAGPSCPGAAAAVAHAGATADQPNQPGLTATERVHELTPAVCRRVAHHVRSCRACRARVPNSVDVAKVLAVAAAPELPEGLRADVASRYANPARIDYRLRVARRAVAFGRAGFPVPVTRHHHVGLMWTAGAAAACAVAMVATFVAQSGQAPQGGPRSRPSAGAMTPSELAARPLTPTFLAGRGVSSGARPASTPPLSGQALPGVPLGLLGPVPLLPLPPVRPGSSGSAGTAVTASDSHSGGTSAPTQGRLEVTPRHLDVGMADSGRIVLEAAGGPVRWRAASSAAALSLDPVAGALEAGDAVTVTITVDRGVAAGGTASVTFAGTDVRVRVTWSAPSPTSPTANPPSSGSSAGAVTPPR